MRPLRVLWHPLTFLLLVVVVLPLATLLAPAEQRLGWLTLNLLVGGPVAAVASAFALRGALAGIPVPEGAPPTSPQERTLQRALRWLVVLVSFLGPLSVFLAAFEAQDAAQAAQAAAATGAAAAGPPAYPVVFLCLLPAFFLVIGWRLWRDLASARRRRAEGQEPLPLEKSSVTGDARLDVLIGRRARVSARLFWITAFVSALGYLSPGHALVAQLAKLNDGIARGELWRFATASFVHSDLIGLAVSGLVLLVVAPLVEVLVGGRWLVFVVVGGGIAATGASFVFAPGHAYMGLTGADAALTGFLLFLSVRQVSRLPPATGRRIAIHGLAAVVILAFAGVLLPTADTAAHLGGFLFGGVVGLLVDPAPAVKAALEKARQEALAAAT